MTFDMNRPVTTLFMLTSVDGKISVGDYEIEQTTDLWSFNSGRVMEKIGMNNIRVNDFEKSPVSFTIVDNSHLNNRGILNLCNRQNRVVLLTSNIKHPAFEMGEKECKNLDIVYMKQIRFDRFFEILKNRYDCDRLTIQSGGTVNSVLLRNGLIDYLDIVMAPILVGGSYTSSLIDDRSFSNVEDLEKLGIFELIGVDTLDDSYVRFRYKVVKPLR